MRVAVTGAAGLIGTAAVRTLANHGHEVIAIDARAVPASNHVTAAHRGRCDDAGFMREALDGAGAVVHLAAYPSPLERDPLTVYRDNTSATFVTLEEAGKAGIRRVVAASSLSVLGMAWAPGSRSPRYVPIDEEHPAFPEDAYSLSKLADELTYQTMSRRHGMTVIGLRFPFVADDDRKVARFEAVRSGQFDASKELWAWLHLQEAAEAIAAGLTADLKGWHICNVAAPDTTHVVSSAELMSRIHPSSAIVAELSGQTSLISSDKARRLLGYAASKTLDHLRDR